MKLVMVIIGLMSLGALAEVRARSFHLGQTLAKDGDPIPSIAVDEELTKARDKKSFNLRITPQVASYRYEEPTVMSIEGTMYGVNSQILFPVSSSIHLGGRFEFMTGNNTYHGGYIGVPGSSFSRGSRDSYIEMGALARFDLSVGEGVPYAMTGVGHRSHTNRIEGLGSYRREIDHTFLALGGGYDAKLSNAWTLTPEFETNLMISGRTKSFLSEEAANTDDLEHRQSNGMGFRVSLQAAYKPGDYGITFGPYYRYWNVEESNVVNGRFDGERVPTIEPKNTTTSFGVNFGATF